MVASAGTSAAKAASALACVACHLERTQIWRHGDTSSRIAAARELVRHCTLRERLAAASCITIKHLASASYSPHVARSAQYRRTCGGSDKTSTRASTRSVTCAPRASAQTRWHHCTLREISLRINHSAENQKWRSFEGGAQKHGWRKAHGRPLYSKYARHNQIYQIIENQAAYRKKDGKAKTKTHQKACCDIGGSRLHGIMRLPPYKVAVTQHMRALMARITHLRAHATSAGL